MIERDKEYYNQKISELYSVIENQEKIIKDLQEEVKGYQTMYFDKVMIVNKALEYIQENKLNGNKISEMLCGSEIVELLEILKGEDKEW